ncbi:unnamed protein product [Lactuca virosa]|uniref:Uncharacterized protein n=1 Tax=Lactuca virosa TaxID=75947 RepID=A0AAU9LK53_9ASTR|nr:unnamed protein product [Lactuca virosa]
MCFKFVCCFKDSVIYSPRTCYLTPPATAPTVPASDVALNAATVEPAAAEEPAATTDSQAAFSALSILIAASTVPAYFVNPGSLQIEKENSNKQAPVGFSCGFIRMSGIPSMDDSLSHPPGFQISIKERTMFSQRVLSTLTQ